MIALTFRLRAHNSKLSHEAAERIDRLDKIIADLKSALSKSQNTADELWGAYFELNLALAEDVISPASVGRAHQFLTKLIVRINEGDEVKFRTPAA